MGYTINDLRAAVITTIDQEIGDHLAALEGEVGERSIDQLYDFIGEVADSVVPVMYDDILSLARSYPRFALDVPEVYAFDGSPTPMNGIAGNAYDYAYNLAQLHVRGRWVRGEGDE